MTLPPRPRPTPQFDPAAFGKKRWFERFFLTNRFTNQIIAAIGKAVHTAMIWPRFFAPYRWKLTRYPLPLGNLPPAFVGYKILQLTDIHAGATKESYLNEVITTALKEKPDLVVITGDLIDYGRDNLRNEVPALQRILEPLLAANVPDGVIAILGNHDYREFSWRHIGLRSAHRTVHKRLIRYLATTPIRLLRNQQHAVTRGDARITIVGMEELWSDRFDPSAAFAGLSPRDPVICLQHNPDGVVPLQPYPWHYMLSGHSHGGQANFPLAGALYVPMKHRQYLRGLYHFPALPGQHLHERTLFVSTGLGHSHPIRLRCPPEATLFTLTAAAVP